MKVSPGRLLNINVTRKEFWKCLPSANNTESTNNVTKINTINMNEQDKNQLAKTDQLCKRFWISDTCSNSDHTVSVQNDNRIFIGYINTNFIRNKFEINQ